jgi:flavin reductase ActVB
MGLPALAHDAVPRPAPISSVPPDPAAQFREAMAHVPSGVAIVTTVDEHGERWGFTASSFCSLSLDPPLVLVCLARTAQCHDSFLGATSWALHLLTADHAELAQRFATRGADKFADHSVSTSDRGLPILDGYSVALECDAHESHEGGDHTILIGHVRDIHLGREAPAVYYQRRFHELPSPTRRYV